MEAALERLVLVARTTDPRTEWLKAFVRWRELCVRPRPVQRQQKHIRHIRSTREMIIHVEDVASSSVSMGSSFAR